MISCRAWFLGLGSALLAYGVGACHEPRGAQPDALVQAPLPAPPRSVEASSPPAALAAAGAPATAPASSGSSAPELAPDAGTPGALAAELPPALLDAEGKALAQTDQRPTLTSPSFQRRVEAVAEAILTGDADRALGAFFPLVAYQQVKDVAKPERDYRFRLVANFKRDVLEYHRALGSAAAEAKFQGVTVSEKDAKWMAPGSEGNKVGYFRVLRSRLRFALPTGRTRDFELTSLISWRGEWYVVHLHGFK